MNRTVVGIDVSRDAFYCCFTSKLADGNTKIAATRRFENTPGGYTELVAWAAKHNKEKQPVLFVMEATGVYYENLAHFLYDQGQQVCVVLANKMKSYFKSLNLKTKTDKVDAKAIAAYGLERRAVLWEPMAADYKVLRDYCRELLALKKDRQRAKSQLHAMNASYRKHPQVVALKQSQIDFCESAMETIEKELRQLVGQDPALKDKIDQLASIPGIGFETALILACETNGFKLFGSIRQVVSYAGLDVSHEESGSFKGSSRISKRGNARIRQALYMPALSALQHNEPIRELYGRICEKNPALKQKGVVAAMRKLLVLSYVIWKKDEKYDREYEWNPKASGNERAESSFDEQKKAELLELRTR
jgi:transposase